MDTDSFVSWSMLRSKKLSSHYQRVCRQWKAILSDDDLTEPAYLKWLHENAGFVFHDGCYRLITISEFEFGADLRADFVICADRASYGFEYEFIEVESPWDPVFTKKGVPSPNLTEAINQIQKWRLWLDANRPEAKRVLPSKTFIVSDQPAFKFTIVIGRRQEKDEWVHMRNQLAERMNIEIRTFDYLTDRLSKRMFFDVPIICSSEFDELPFALKNALASPFFTALRSSIWRKLVKAPNFSSHHMIANNATELLGALSHNSGYTKYLTAWNALPDAVRMERYEDARQFA